MAMKAVAETARAYQASAPGTETVRKERAAAVSAPEVKVEKKSMAEAVPAAKSVADAPNAKQDAGERKDAADVKFVGTEALKKAVEEINRNAKNSEVIFGIHERTNRLTIKIVDKETKELIREYPPEKMLDMIAKVWEMAGLMVDEKR